MLSGKSLRVSAGRSIGMPSLRDEPTHSGSSLRRSRSTARRSGPPPPPGCGPHDLLRGRNIPFNIQNPFRAAACEGTHKRMRVAGLRAAKLRPAAVPYRNRKFMIQNSRFKIRWGCRAVCIPIRVAACGELARCGPAGRELRASAAGRLRPADACGIGSACCKPAATDFRQDILQHTRLRSSRQPAAAPGRRAAISRSSKAGPSARLRAGPELGPVRQDRAGRSFAPRRPAAPLHHRRPSQAAARGHWAIAAYFEFQP